MKTLSAHFVLSVFFLVILQAKAFSAGNLIIGILENYNNSEQGKGHVVRVVFQKEGGEWKAFKHDFNTPDALHEALKYFPKKVKWNICFRGKTIGTLVSRIPQKLNYYSKVGTHLIDAHNRIPVIGIPTAEFSGWPEGVTYRPLVLNSKLYCTDSDKWEPYKPKNSEFETVLKFLTEKFKITKTQMAKASIEQNKCFRSRIRGLKLLSVTIYDKTTDSSEMVATFGPGDNIWCLLDGETIRYVQSEMVFVDAGDYDNDGKSEIIFKVQKYNYDGYILYSADSNKCIELGWSYQ